MRGSYRHVVALVAALAVVLVGCQVAPQDPAGTPATPPAPTAPQPALTLDQAAAVFTRARRVAAASDKALSISRLPEVYTGLELARSRVAVSLSRRGDRKNQSTLAAYTFVPVQVWSSPADRFPQTALVQSRIKGHRYPKARVLHQLVRADAEAPWLVAQGLYPKDNPLGRRPTLVDGVSERVAGSTVVAGLRLSWVEQSLVEGLNRPDSAAAKRFRGQPRRQEFSDVEQRNREVGHKQLDFATRPGAFWQRTPDGGAVGLVPLTFRDTLTARDEQYLTLDGALARTYDRHYQRVSQVGLVNCLVEVPADGLITVRDCEWSWGELSVSRGG